MTQEIEPKIEKLEKLEDTEKHISISADIIGGNGITGMVIVEQKDSDFYKQVAKDAEEAGVPIEEYLANLFAGGI